jgi:hypothetical protein
MTGDEILVDIAMRDYLSVRADMSEVRAQSVSLVTATLTAFAVGFSALAVLAPTHTDSATFAAVLLTGAALLELASMTLIGLDGSHKIVEDLNRRQANDLRSLLERVSGGPVPPTLLSLQVEVQEIMASVPSRVWLVSYGAWSVAGLVVPLLAIACTIAGGILTFSGSSSDALHSLALILLLVDVAGGACLVGLAVLGSLFHRDRDTSQ